KRVEQKSEIVNQRIVRPESRANRRFPVSEDVPCQPYSRAEQPLRIILCEYRVGDTRVGHKHTRRANQVIGGSSQLLVPTRGEFLSNAGAEREVRRDPNRILEVPRPEKASPVQLVGTRHNLKCAHVPLEERFQAQEGGLPKTARSAVFIVLEPLKPRPETDLMNTLADQHIVGIGEEISAIRNSRSIAGAS